MTIAHELDASNREVRGRLGVAPPPPRRRIVIPPKALPTPTSYQRPLAAERRRVGPIELAGATALVESHYDVPARMLLNPRSTYPQVTAAREMLWTMLFDGGHSAAGIAAQFGVSLPDVRLGIARFRAFMADRQSYTGGKRK